MQQEEKVQQILGKTGGRFITLTKSTPGSTGYISAVIRLNYSSSSTSSETTSSDSSSSTESNDSESQTFAGALGSTFRQFWVSLLTIYDNHDTGEDSSTVLYDISELSGSSSTSTAGNGNIISACEEVTKLVLQHTSVYHGVYGTDIASVYNKAVTEGTNIVCATYVSMVLYHAGVVQASALNKYAFHSVSGLKEFFEENGWTKVDNSQMQAGDVLLKFSGQRHAMVYAGDSKTWDESSCVWTGSSNSTKPSGTTKTRSSSYLSQCEVWRP